VSLSALLVKSAKGVEMTTKLYVGNLPHDTSEEQIHALFAQAGEVGRIKFALDRETLLPKGFAFVAMTTEEGNQEAIKRFNGYMLGANILKVRTARLRKNHLRSGRE
jgi:RNA recognition motif-containing protein